MSIESLVAAGRFVIVAEYPIYCRITDALTGTGRAIVSDHATHEEAEAVCPEDHEDLSHVILPRPVPVREIRSVPLDAEDGDICF